MGNPVMPREIDLLAVGDGTARTALVGSVVRETSLNALLLEAHSAPGPPDCGNWSPELLDVRSFALIHDWTCSGPAHASQPELRSCPREYQSPGGASR